MKVLEATVETGRREAAGFVSLPWVASQLAAQAGFAPYPGTLNLRLEDEASRALWRELVEAGRGWTLAPPEEAFCSAACFPVLVEGDVPGTIVRPAVPDYPTDVVEVLAGENLRERFGLRDGARCRLDLLCPPAFSRVLFDLEGTLVDFQWQLAPAEAELRAAAIALGVPPDRVAAENYAGVLHQALARAGSDRQRDEILGRLSPIYDRYDADALSRWSLREGASELLRDLRTAGARLALVTNIGEAAARAVLGRFGIDGRFDAVVTRNQVLRMKPSGEGIHRALHTLGCREPALMVGDSLSDLYAARDAGVAVALVTGGECAPDLLRAHGPDHLVSSLAETRRLFWPDAPA